jgi:hypothetical protein
MLAALSGTSSKVKLTMGAVAGQPQRGGMKVPVKAIADARFE